MTTLLVANRGEIARRITRTARRMGMRVAVVHSDADAGAPFTREADVAIRIGPAPAPESYLSIERIIAAAREAQADLIHPGYGFLSERADFARAVIAERMRFVGPPPEVLSALGDKAVAKAIARRAGAPLLPGHDGDDQRDDTFLTAARAVGYPVMVKPLAGGGGIGMQLVVNESELRDALARARRIASNAFGDERLLLERAIDRPRHVEVQILADQHGTVLALGERDCSVQRRQQKVLEEAPAPGMDEPLRGRLHAHAIAIAREAGYESAGTVEFLVDGAGAPFFIEVNARLQVEHPVTEAVLDIDLVEQQLRISLGERLSNATPSPRGHAVEVRLYAEDPAAGFLPARGTAAHVRWPESVRIDAGIEEGDEVTTDYDPMLAKVIAHAADRGAALDALAEALDRLEVLGVPTNRAFLRALVVHPVLRSGSVDTGFLAREMPRLAPGAPAPSDEAFALAAAAALDVQRDATDPWTRLGSWRLGTAPEATVVLPHGAEERVVRARGTGPWSVEGRHVVRGAEHHRYAVDGADASAVGTGGAVWVSWNGAEHELALGPRERSATAALSGGLTAPMPGRIVSVHARRGDAMKRGQLLFLMEAMKMELRVEAPGDGVVTRVLVGEGDVVARGQPLAELGKTMQS